MQFLYHPKIEREEWNAFVFENDGGFLQSFEWGEFQTSVGNRVVRVMVRDSKEIVLCANIFIYKLPFDKQYAYIPFGPVLLKAVPEAKELLWKFFIAEMQERLEDEVVFLRIEPHDTLPESVPKFFGFVLSEKRVQFPETVVCDLSLSEEDLLSRMKQKTRYNIKVAMRHGVKIIGMDMQQKLDKGIFLSLLKETAKRNHFHAHPDAYYLDMMDMFLTRPIETNAPQFSERLFYAQYNGVVIATALVGFFGHTAIYLHGASSMQYKKVMAPYLLHFEIMKYAKNKGFFYYDFGGVSTEKSYTLTKGKWGGFSKFKFGFGGDSIEYPLGYDMVFSSFWYRAYNAGRRIASFVRGPW